MTSTARREKIDRHTALSLGTRPIIRRRSTPSTRGWPRAGSATATSFAPRPLSPAPDARPHVTLQALARAEPDRALAGVVHGLVLEVRRALDAEDFGDVGIWVSGGFTPARIGRFEEAALPVTGYGVGSSLLGHNRGEVDGLINGFDFTADIVPLDDRRESNVGREPRPNPRMVRLDPSLLDRLE